jgi:chemotaxis response regulator CheB
MALNLPTPWLSIPSALMIGILTLSSFSNWLGDLKASADSKNAKIASLDAQQLNLEIAEKRFSKGCSQVVQNGKPVSIKENMPIYGTGASTGGAKATLLPLADGTVVCSAQDGGTAVMANGVTNQFAQNIEAAKRYFKTK